MIIDSIATYLKDCPLIKGNKINANFLDKKPTVYSIDNVPADPIIVKYPDGGSKRQFLFVFASRDLYGKEAVENFRNSGFYEQFAAWIEEQNAARKLPKLDDGLEPLKVETLTGGYCFDQSTDEARYQIQCRLIYNKEGVI